MLEIGDMVISAFTGLIGLGPASRDLCWNTRSYGGILTFWLLLLGDYLGGGR